jgi:arylsulfatase A-like enzyme
MQLDKALASLGAVLACAMASVSLSAPSTAAAAAQSSPSGEPDERPNVVVLYLDDVSPKTPWLWSNRERTPNLARFRQKGVEFRHAVGSTPLCGPSRATLLTGQYSHNHGVTGNNLRGFDPSDTLATRLQDVGYQTMLVGKAGNGIEDDAPRRRDVERQAQGFDHYDVIWKRPVKFEGQFYGYSMWTRNGVLRKGYRSQDHSTYVVGQRLADHIREARPDQPLFAIASLNSGHEPNTPFRWHEDAEACERVAPYRAPSYNEKNVSDKPAYIRKLPRLKRASFDLRSRCEEFLGVDATLRRIRGALHETGRLRNTLFVLTADNGYLMGDHRMPGVGDKWWPHAIPVPLYFLWPEVLGNERRTVHEPVSSVDLPVTICALAGCELADADGLDITPLLRGEAARLDRDYLYLELLRPREEMPPWYGLLTTRAFDEDVLFQYVEYRSGERELYNLTRDPYRLHNLAAKERKNVLLEELHRRLHEEVIEPEGVTFPPPRPSSRQERVVPSGS